MLTPRGAPAVTRVRPATLGLENSHESPRRRLFLPSLPVTWPCNDMIATRLENVPAQTAMVGSGTPPLRLHLSTPLGCDQRGDHTLEYRAWQTQGQAQTCPYMIHQTRIEFRSGCGPAVQLLG